MAVYSPFDMMVGHAMLAFALVAGGARLLGWPAERALRVGGVAGAFALVPDADMVYALSGVIGADASGVFVVANSFWGASTEVHRSATHSLVLAVPAAVAFALWTARGRATSVASVGLLSALWLVAYLATGPVAAFAVGTFALAGLGVATVAERFAALSPRAVGATALVALVSHPFGDLFTGSVPALLYPLDVAVFADIVVLHPDPPLHLLGAFGLELATIWLAGAVHLHLTDTSPLDVIDRSAALGICYAPAALVLPAPTLEVSYHFVFTVVGLGIVLAVPAIRELEYDTVVGQGPGPAETDGGSTADGPPGSGPGAKLGPGRGIGPGPGVTPPLPDRRAVVGVVMTVTAGVTAAWGAYLVAYLLT